MLFVSDFLFLPAVLKLDIYLKIVSHSKQSNRQILNSITMHIELFDIKISHLKSDIIMYDVHFFRFFSRHKTPRWANLWDELNARPPIFKGGSHGSVAGLTASCSSLRLSRTQKAGEKPGNGPEDST